MNRKSNILTIFCCVVYFASKIDSEYDSKLYQVPFQSELDFFLASLSSRWISSSFPSSPPSLSLAHTSSSSLNRLIFRLAPKKNMRWLSHWLRQVSLRINVVFPVKRHVNNRMIVVLFYHFMSSFRFRTECEQVLRLATDTRRDALTASAYDCHSFVMESYIVQTNRMKL